MEMMAVRIYFCLTLQRRQNRPRVCANLRSGPPPHGEARFVSLAEKQLIEKNMTQHLTIGKKGEQIVAIF